MKKLKFITSIMLAALIAVSSTAVFSAANVKTPTLKLANTSKGVKAKWSKISGASKYTLAYKVKGSSKYKKAYTGSKTSFTFKSVKASKTYTFKVKAQGGKYSKAKTITFLKRITKLTAAEDLDMKGIVLKWKGVKGAKSYRIYRSVKSKNSFKKIATVSSSTKKYHDTKNLKSIESYKYYLVAVNGKSKSAKSVEAHDIYGYYDRATDAPLTLTIKKGVKYMDIYEKLDKYFATGLVSWKSLNKSVVKVNSFGVFTGVKKGTATVNATVAKGAYKNNKKKTIKIIVTVK